MTARVEAIEGVLESLSRKVDSLSLTEKVGMVTRVTGLLIEAEGPESSMGQVCYLSDGVGGEEYPAEVVGFRHRTVLLMALTDIPHLGPGWRVVARGHEKHPGVGEGLLGRVVDALGRPLDQRGPVLLHRGGGSLAMRVNPLMKMRIKEVFETGVSAIDAFCPLGLGQRIGIFAGSGVGKSTLLGMLARASEAEINVIALIGERGRELREFIEKDLGEEGLRKSVVVVATSDQPAPFRIRAATYATQVAEYFRAQGKKVLMLMDSVTRLALAQREIGLAVGEPPTTRGYTPSVFSLLPRILEKTGTSDVGAITAVYTVLVEGDDLNEPVADAVRGILDGHVVLSRALATSNHFPAIDVLESVSRLIRDICPTEDLELAAKARDLLALYRKNEDLINIGAYQAGSQSRLDKAVETWPRIMNVLRQPPDKHRSRANTLKALQEAVA